MFQQNLADRFIYYSAIVLQYLGICPFSLKVRHRFVAVFEYMLMIAVQHVVNRDRYFKFNSGLAME